MKPPPEGDCHPGAHRNRVSSTDLPPQIQRITDFGACVGHAARRPVARPRIAHYRSRLRDELKESSRCGEVTQHRSDRRFRLRAAAVHRKNAAAAAGSVVRKARCGAHADGPSAIDRRAASRSGPRRAGVHDASMNESHGTLPVGSTSRRESPPHKSSKFNAPDSVLVSLAWRTPRSGPAQNRRAPVIAKDHTFSPTRSGRGRSFKSP